MASKAGEIAALPQVKAISLKRFGDDLHEHGGKFPPPRQRSFLLRGALGTNMCLVQVPPQVCLQHKHRLVSCGCVDLCFPHSRLFPSCLWLLGIPELNLNSKILRGRSRVLTCVPGDHFPQQRSGD